MTNNLDNPPQARIDIIKSDLNVEFLAWFREEDDRFSYSHMRLTHLDGTVDQCRLWARWSSR